MSLFKISFKSSSSYVDSIKISRAIIYAYNTLYPDKIDDLINKVKDSYVSVSDLLLYKNKVYYPFPPINALIDVNNTESIKNRKKRSEFIDIDELSSIVEAFKETGYQGVNYSKIKHEGNGDNKGKPHKILISEPGINIFQTPEIKDNKYKYNDIFTKELFIYDESCFYARNSDKNIEATINLLNDFGLSGRRSTGKGEVYIEKINDNFNEGFNGEGIYILLSSFIPDNDYIKNIDFERSRYNIKTLQGKNINGNPIGPFRYFAPGSIFYLKGDVKGVSFIENNGIIPFNPVITKVL
ncbi:TVG0113769 [Thermoplasma volcanium GSS1]|uniref:CRISPR system Cms protein Csm4 n=1 Tax=Thermoplasma volcanium (strain ATCC 51530 / DSM 4299 / JCM 9571 / NBRC 15438 / GSS1) TaxID=273116 RepID=Q97CJ3_THEVO|nr:type III-A CRISPR-associated RAMP protein Csm4 [Thermoplasma volcanium]BAB59250.1 TVG0113769 [Thermoplasma volcanium GSS1]